MKACLKIALTGECNLDVSINISKITILTKHQNTTQIKAEAHKVLVISDKSN